MGMCRDWAWRSHSTPTQYVYKIISILHSTTHTARNSGILATVSKIKADFAREFTSAVGMAERQFLYPEADADLPHHYPANSPKHVTEVMETHPPVWPASRCTYGTNGHVT